MTLEQQIKALQAKVNALEYAEKINETLFKISEAVNTTHDLDALYASIHESLGRLIDVSNFYIAIHDSKNNLLIFPYAKDEKDEGAYNDIRIFVEDSLTGEVIFRKQPLFLTHSALLARAEGKKIQGTTPLIWLGVPLIITDQVIGIMAVQSYTDANCYTRKDLEVLVSVSNQIAMAISRKRNNEIILKNEERYRNLAEHSHDIIMRFDRSFRLLYVNPAVSQIGLHPEQMIGKFHTDIGFDPGLVAAWDAAIDKVFTTGEINRLEFRLPNGTWLDWLLCPEFSTDRRISSVITFARDISQQKQVEYSQRCFNRINQIIINADDLEEMQKNILDAMLDVFDCDRAWLLYPCDPDAEFYESPFTRNRPKWPKEAVFKIRITPEVRQTLSQLLASDEPLAFDPVSGRAIRKEMRNQRHIQSQIMMAVYPKIGDPWVVGLHQCTHERIWTPEDRKLFKDVCARITDGLSSMLFKRELVQAKSYIDDVINSMPSVLVGVDESGTITQWNMSASAITGLDKSTAIGQKVWDIFDHLAFLKTELSQAIQEKAVFEKLRLIRHSGPDLYYENLTVYPLAGTGETGAVLRIDDVTEKVQIEEMMIQSEKMVSVGGLAAGMAHEINNPLAGMMQNAQLLINRLTVDLPANISAAQSAGTSMAAIRQFMGERDIIKKLENINTAGIRAADIVKNMLSFAKKGPGEKQYENLPDLFDRSVALIRSDYNLKKKFDIKSVEVNQTVSAGFPLVNCEATKLQQVFINILKNGTEAMQANIEAMTSKPGFQVAFSHDQDTIRIRISDNGPGMDADTQKRIFEPFYTTKSPDKGTGLGLSMAYFIIVNTHRGKLGVESAPGRGTSFSIELPVHGGP